MGGLLLIARLALAGVFALAAVGKLTDRNARRAMIRFGVPASLATPVVIALPLAEIGVAVALIPAPTARLGALASVGLLSAFTIAIVVNLALGRRPDCNCFGQVHSSRVGAATILRNLALGAVAAFIAWGGPGLELSAAVARVADLMLTPSDGDVPLRPADVIGAAAGIALFALVVIQGWLVFNLIRQNGRLLSRVEVLEAATGAADVPRGPLLGLPIGAPAPGLALSELDGFSLSNPRGEAVSLRAVCGERQAVLLVFCDPEWGSCKEFLPQLARWQKEDGANVRVVLISRGSARLNRRLVADYGLSTVLVQRGRELSKAYGAKDVPSAVLIRADGRIGSRVARGAEAIAGLHAQARSPKLSLITFDAAGATPPKLGHAAPPLSLPDLTGRTVDLWDFRGEEVVLLFWSPHCGYCKEMLRSLKRWERRAAEEAPRLVLVASGGAETNRAMGLRSAVVLDEDRKAGDAFGSSGTPSAVLVDRAGRIASEVVVGAEEVLALFGIPRGYWN